MNDLCNSPFVTKPLDDPSTFKSNCENENRAYATLSVPWQTPGKLYSACEGLRSGTVFANLDQPYACGKCAKPVKEACDCG